MSPISPRFHEPLHDRRTDYAILVRAQNISLAPSWITRVVTPCTPPPMAPKVAERILRSSEEGSGLKWFVRLKISVRNSRSRPSERRNVLFTEKSALPIPGRRMALVRGDVPKRPKGASTKAAVLNHRFHVRWSRGRSAFCPATESGRELIPVPVVSTLLVTGAGKPLWNVTIVETCQPSSRARLAPCIPRKNGTS